VPILIDPRLFEEEGDVAPWSPPTPAADAPTPAVDSSNPQVDSSNPQVDSSTMAAESSTMQVEPPLADNAVEPTREGAAEGNSPVPPAEHPTALAVPAAKGVAGT
jgi:hypothetical protein